MMHIKRHTQNMRNSRRCFSSYIIHIEDGDDKVDYYFKNVIIYKLDKLCVPKGERLHLNRESHTSKVVGHVGVGKTVAKL
jgi:hypothetical protein